MHAATAAADRPGGVSIVLQGAVDRASIDGLVGRCHAWRRLLPAAQIVCAVSSSDGVDTSSLSATCDAVVFADAWPALPPIKTDAAGPNNVNRMIAAARVGIAAATGAYLLRIRNDLLFRNRAFLTLYDVGAAHPRGDWAVFEQRVLIPEIFTLNPYSHSRMPFHFSDWCHFGLRGDIAAIWTAAQPMSDADAIYYTTHRHRRTSLPVERRFLSRLAPEQAVHFPVLARAFPQLRLGLHNDLTSIEQSMLVCVDNFTLANLSTCQAHIPKYQGVVDRMSEYTRLECLSEPLVRTRAARRNDSAARVFADLSRAARHYRAPIRQAGRRLRSTWFRLLRRLRLSR